MKTIICVLLAAWFCLLVPSEAKESPPTVQVYSRYPGMWDQKNVLICHVSGFHPPQIVIELLKNGQVMSDTTQSDLAFEDSWRYLLTKHVHFTPAQGERFTCRVTHVGKAKTYDWEPDSE